MVLFTVRLEIVLKAQAHRSIAENASNESHLIIKLITSTIAAINSTFRIKNILLFYFRQTRKKKMSGFKLDVGELLSLFDPDAVAEKASDDYEESSDEENAELAAVVDSFFQRASGDDDEEGEDSESEEEEREYAISDDERARADEQVRAWLDDVHRELSVCLEDLSKLSIPGGSPWYRRDSAPFYYSLLDISLRVTQIIDTAMDIEDVRIDSQLLRQIYFHLYGTMIRYAKPMCAPLPGKDDAISTTPIYSIFHTVCHILVYTHESDDLNSPLFLKSPASNEYCVEHSLFVNREIPIENYNIEMLCQTIYQLEMFWRLLPVANDLNELLTALELCFAYFVCYTHDDNAHNVESLRIDAGSTGEYYPSKELVFEMAVRFVSFYEEIGAAKDIYLKAVLPSQRMKLLLPKDSDVEKLKQSLISESRKVHSDSYTDAVRKNRQNMAVYPSECYLFFKENPTVHELEPEKVFETFRPVVAWKDLCDTYATVKPHEMFESLTDPLGVRVALPLLMDVICTQDLKRRWEDFYIPFTAFFKGNREEMIMSLLKNSAVNPIYVMCMNDAYVIFDGNCYNFGATCVGYLKALVFWINIVQYWCGAYVGSTSFREFYITTMGSECRNDVLRISNVSVPFYEGDMDDGPDAITTDLSLVECLIDEDVFYGVRKPANEEKKEEEGAEGTESSSNDENENWGDIF